MSAFMVSIWRRCAIATALKKAVTTALHDE
jgi:hypothetical protein